MSIILVKPVFKERIWGSHFFKEVLKYDLSDQLFGEKWSLSAHKEGETEIINGIYKGKTLSLLYKECPNLFNTPYEEFPLMVKLLDTNDLLSVQVHPDDEYASIVEKQYGKTECWYFLNSEEDSSIVMGHNAGSKEEMKSAIENGKCESLLSYHQVKNGDFVLIPSKTVHALGKHLLLLEIQQSSDVTYRLYDYNRIGTDGKKRALHVDKALDVIDFPERNVPSIKNFKEEKDCTLTDCKYFTVKKKEINEEATIDLPIDTFYMISVADGDITVNDGEKDYTLKLGDTFLVTARESSITLKGNGTVLVTNPK